MDELYKLSKVAKELTFDYSGALGCDKADIIEWIMEISEFYENHLANPETFYSLILDVNTNEVPSSLIQTIYKLAHNICNILI